MSSSPPFADRSSSSLFVQTLPFVETLSFTGSAPPLPVISSRIKDLVHGYCTFNLEKQYNVYRSLTYPYCTLCMMFNNKNLTFKSDWYMNASRFVMQPLSNLCQLSHARFRYAAHGGSECLKSDILIRCKNCHLTVHELCYDVSKNINNTGWLCDRCQKNISPTSCAYCPLKGGVFKETGIYEWAHPECNLLVKSRSSLNTPIVSSRTDEPKQTCVVCNLMIGQCFRCSEHYCNVWFHVSCGIFAGFNFRIDPNNEKNILTCCSAHS